MSKEKDTPNQTPQQYWNDYVTNSRGSAVFVPEKFQKEYKKVLQLRDEFNELLRTTVAKKEIDLQVQMQSVVHEIRKYLEENGHKDIFFRECRLNADAEKDGILVMNIFDPQPRN